MYKGLMDKDNGGEGRIECGRWGWVGWGRVMGENEDNCNSIINKYILKKSIHMTDTSPRRTCR